LIINFFIFKKVVGGKMNVAQTIQMDFTHPRDIRVKTKYNKRYKEFSIPSSYDLKTFKNSVKESLGIPYEGEASVITAYCFWLLLGFFGMFGLF
jgi:hypothetical protein